MQDRKDERKGTVGKMGEWLKDPGAQRRSLGEEGLQFWLLSEVALQLLVQR